MLSANILSMKMPLSEALAVSLIGIATVIVILAVIACLIILVSKAIRAIEAKTSSEKEETPAPAPAAPMAKGTSAGQVELINTNEKEAAVIMAIVAEKTGLSLERLSFKSIKLMEDEKKGDENK
ncbi:MAG: OadG family protein [Clostridia bacterium]|nr:OadG family protein [Clostridia bacterium]